MECLPDHPTLFLCLTQYGSFVLFILLALGIVALPVPEETLMVLAGIMMHQGTLPLLPTVAAAFGGSVCGITMSYFIGLWAGHYLVRNYGKTLGLTEDRLQKAHSQFERFGTWALFIGYFIPGVRHFTGFLAGMTELTYKRFALFAYLGALFWVSSFLSIGYFFGNYCFDLYARFNPGATELIIGAGVLLSVYLIYKNKHRF